MAAVTIDDSTTDPLPAGHLHSIKMVTPPSSYSLGDYFWLVEDMPDGSEVTHYNVHIGSTPFPTGSFLVENAEFKFSNLRVKNCPPGASFELDIDADAPEEPPVEPPAKRK